MKLVAAAAVLGIAAAVATIATAGGRAGPEGPAARGGAALIDASTRARAVVAGELSGVAPLDVHGWRADLRVDRSLLGGVRIGDTVTIAWEELSSGRRVRFANGERVLVVLDALPTQSLWRKRFASVDRARGVFVVASDGDAFLSRPDGPTVEGLAHYLAMTSEARTGTPGADKLAELVRGAQPAVAHEALALLESDTTRAAALDDDGTASLLDAARAADRDATLRGGALRLAARLRVPGTRQAAVTLAAAGSPIRADAYRALAALPGGLPADQRDALLADADPELRAVGIEAGGSQLGRERLVSLARDDRSAGVRLAAGRALLARTGSDAIADVVPMLDDAEASVRSGMAESIGGLGAAAVAPLRAVVEHGSEQAALAAVLGLSRSGRTAGPALAAIADTHPNASVRAFAHLALGKAPKPPY